MNLYLRLLLTLWRSRRAPRLALGDTLTRTLRVLPNDLDLNGHMNNGRYLTIIDLMLVEYFVRTGFAATMVRKGWRPMSGGSFITYRRGLKPFQAYTLRFRVDGGDSHWNFMRFEFMANGKVCAAGYMKGAAVAKSGLVPNALSYSEVGLPPPNAALPSPVRNWLAAEHDIVSAAW